MRFNEDPVSILTSQCEIKMGVFANNGDDSNNNNKFVLQPDQIYAYLGLISQIISEYR